MPYFAATGLFEFLRCNGFGSVERDAMFLDESKKCFKLNELRLKRLGIEYEWLKGLHAETLSPMAITCSMKRAISGMTPSLRRKASKMPVALMASALITKPSRVNAGIFEI
ncbi:hypothetical protein D3C87_1895870 [compost metagenome]